MRNFKHIVSKKEEGLPLKTVIKEGFHFSSRLMTKLKQQHLIFLNGTSSPGWVEVKEGDEIRVTLPEEKNDFPPEDIPIDVVYEDEDLLVINKQPFFVVHPTKGKPCHTIANGLSHMITKKNQSYKIRFVNRLDMNTSGLLIIAKNSYAQDHMVKQMEKNRLKKKYLAIVEGSFKEKKGKIEFPLGRPDENHVERWVLPVEKGGHPSLTYYEVLDSFKLSSNLIDQERKRINENTLSLVELELETGRTHQIRVHMAYTGHPILGDHLYCHGDPFLWREKQGIETEYRRDYIERGETPPETNPEIVSCLIGRQALHAFSLSFKHPVTDKDLLFTSPLPEDMKTVIKQIR